MTGTESLGLPSGTGPEPGERDHPTPPHRPRQEPPGFPARTWSRARRRRQGQAPHGVASGQPGPRRRTRARPPTPERPEKQRQPTQIKTW